MGKETQQNGFGMKPHSVYDYPEHLNPFYQDENHKRLRFWTLKKGKDGGKGNSFSMSNLRDLWAFKTFSLKKKSSTLGINKTSESPPPLRKYGNERLYDSNYNTYDSRYRQTIGGGGGSTTDVAFERNAPYRATVTGTMNPPSAKNYDTQSDIVFNRHESYRHTIQNVQKSRNNPSSVTPVLNQRRMQSSVSQSSLRSTNPFDDDYENNENTSPNQQDTIVENGGVLKGSARRPYKKKRRAPPPPIVQQYVPVLPQESGASNNLKIDEVELKIVEEETPSRQETPARDDDLATIRMITAEIETLYKDLEREEEKLKISEETAAQTVVKEPEIVEKVEKKVETEKIVVHEEKIEEPVVIVDRVEVIHMQRAEQPTIETRAETPKPEQEPAEEVEITQETVTQTNAIEMRVHEEKEEVVVEPHVTFNEVNDVHIIREPSVVSSVTTNQSPEPSPDREPEQQQEILQLHTKSYRIDEPLMIVEPPTRRDLDEPVPSTFPRRSEGSVTAFEIKYKQLKDGPDSRFMLQRRRSLKEKERKEFMQRALNLDRSQSVDIRRNLDEEFEIYNHYHNGHANGDKRRSVKEIIESINRNQSLLQATNYTPLNGKYDYNNVAASVTPNNTQKPVIPPKPAATTTKIDEEIVELRNPASQNGRGSYYDNVPEILEQLQEQAATFQKCKTPPRKDFDWNPVPKPRRSRNFSEEREIPRNEGLKEYY
ncbi:LOW QUALITY PROTEIN: rac guanine nucleotide exchange factor JJ [Culicoides brevitarsis]|uniref:LOW QUALITY PROTEIN: rac guanine nucleotide exchange factor JJ n=1 Tax=Culicoides brevitarsis TaxID=469753 RepID=UPI00307B9B16